MHTFLLVILLFSVAFPEQSPTAGTATKSAIQKGAADTSTEMASKLLSVRRVYVDSFGDDAVGKQLHATIIAGLADSKRFIVTENKEKADAIVKGTGLETSSQEIHAYSEGTAVGRAAIQDAATSTETAQNARVAVRIIDRDGDVIWSSTQESKGGKYKGATADAADKVVKQLLRDLERFEKKRSESAVAPSR